MRKNWKRWIAGLLTAVMLVTMLPTVAYAAVGDLLDMSGVQRTALLAALEEVYGDDAEAYLAILKQYGLIDEDGNEVEFEHIDTVEYNGVTYLAFIPAEISIEEDAEVVIMQIVEENGEELLEAVEDDEIADAVFNIVMERAEAEEE